MIYLGADHRGFELKEKVKEWLEEWGEEYEDMGNVKYDPEDDFPDYAIKVAEKVAKGGGLGVLACGSGGMVMVANKFKGVWAAEVWDVERARHAKAHDDVNVLALPADVVSEGKAKEIIKVWLETVLKKEEKYQRRLDKIRKIEEDNFK